MKLFLLLTAALLATAAILPSNGDSLTQNCYANEAFNDPVCFPPTNPNGSGHAFWDATNAFGGDLYFKTASGAFAVSADIVQKLNGEIHLTGYLGNANYLFRVELRFYNVQDYTTYVNNGGIVKKELNQNCYGGNPVDVTQFVFYDFEGSMTAMGNSPQWANGGVISISRGNMPFAHFGAGANNKNTLLGLSLWVDLAFDTVNSPNGQPLLSDIETFDGDFNLNINCPEPCPPADAESTAECFDVLPSPVKFAVWIPGICEDLVWEDDQVYQEKPYNAILSGKVVCASNPDWKFDLVAYFSDRVAAKDAAANDIEPKLEGCAENDQHWYYWKTVTGKLVSTGNAFSGGVLSFTRYLPNGQGNLNPGVQVGYNANGKNANYGLATWLVFAIEQAGSTAPMNPTLPQHGDINIDLCPPSDCPASEADYEAPCNNPNIPAHAIWLPEICAQFVWVGGVGNAQGFKGYSVLTGTVVCATDDQWKFEVELFINNVIPYQFLAGFGGECKKEGCNQDCSNDWYYVDVSGTMHSVGSKFNGGVISVYRAQINGMGEVNPFGQIGPDANGKNQEFGAAVWFDAAVTETGSTAPMNPNVQRAGNLQDGDVNINICPPEPKCPAKKAIYEAPCNNPAITAHAVWLPKICGNGVLVFDGESEYIEGNDIATLSGVVYCPNDPEWRFKILVSFENKVSAADAASENIEPKFEGCGNSDAGWFYYRDVTGIFKSIGAKFTGGEIAITRALVNGQGNSNPATQIGFNANGKNANYGLSSWFYAQVVKSGSTAPANPNVSRQNGQPGDIQDGDFNLDLCPPVSCENRVTCSPSFEVDDCQFAVQGDAFCLMLNPFQFQNGCWKVTAGEVDLKNTYWTAFDGAKSVDLNGRKNGELTSAAVALEAGTYRLTFWYAGNVFDDSVKTADVAVFDANDNTQYLNDNVTFDNAAVGATTADMKWVKFEGEFTLANDSEVQMQFTSTSAQNDRFGVAVDAVSIVPAVCP